MKYNTYTLPYGLRVIHLPSNSPVVYCGYEIAAGTRDEEKGDEGLAHFCEHVSFKGTRHRSAWNILNCLESVGGDLNAYTNKEDTVYYAAILKEHVDRAVDLLSDIVFQSTFPQPEIDKEVKVICDEIESYNDSPAELIYDDFENILLEGHPLGHNILGNAERVCRFTTEDAMRFTRKNYRPENMIFFAYGEVDFKKLIKKLEKIEIPDNASIKGDSETSTHTCSAPVIEKIYKNIGGSTIIRDKNTHQAHVMLGSRAYNAYDDEHRMPLYLLNNILGGMGMNAIFNVQLREKRGLVYTVDSSMVSYGDTGMWCTDGGCDQEDVKKCLRIISRYRDKMMQTPLTERQLNAAKKQLKGQIGVSCDNRENFALDFGKSFLHGGKEKDILNLYRKIDAIKPENMQKVAQEIFDPQGTTTLIYK